MLKGEYYVQCAIPQAQRIHIIASKEHVVHCICFFEYQDVPYWGVPIVWYIFIVLLHKSIVNQKLYRAWYPPFHYPAMKTETSIRSSC